MIPAPAPEMARSFLVVVFGPTKGRIIQVAEAGEGSRVLRRTTHTNLQEVIAAGAAMGFDRARMLMLVAEQLVEDAELNLEPGMIDTAIEVSSDDGVTAMIAVYLSIFQITHGGRLPEITTVAAMLDADGVGQMMARTDTIGTTNPAGPVGEA